MKKIRGFKLGRRLVQLWRRVSQPLCRRRRWRTPYRRLAATPPPSPSNSPPRHHHESKQGREMGTMIARWGRCLCRRLAHTPRGGAGEDGAAEESYRGRLLGAEHGHRWQQRPPPKGHLVVYVGRRGVDPVYRVPVPVVYFNHPLFRELLRAAAEEFGFHHAGGITIPCAMADFESVRNRVATAAGVSCRHRGRPVIAAGRGDVSWWSPETATAMATRC